MNKITYNIYHSDKKKIHNDIQKIIGCAIFFINNDLFHRIHLLGKVQLNIFIFVIKDTGQNIKR